MGDSASQIKTLNRWVARIVPIFLIGIVGYVTFVIVVSICGKQSKGTSIQPIVNITGQSTT